jgi:hypothetical protein
MGSRSPPVPCQGRVVLFSSNACLPTGILGPSRQQEPRRISFALIPFFLLLVYSLVDLRQVTTGASASSIAGYRRGEQPPLLLLHLEHLFVRDLVVVPRPLQLQVGRLQGRRSVAGKVPWRANNVAVRAVVVAVGVDLQRVVGGTRARRPSEAPVPALRKKTEEQMGDITAR